MQHVRRIWLADVDRWVWGLFTHHRARKPICLAHTIRELSMCRHVRRPRY